MKPSYQDAVDDAEVSALEAQWGALPLHRQRLAVDHPFLTGEHQLLVSDGRRAEICYIMHRGHVDEGVLLHVKTFYPRNAYRLPTGGIHQGEPVMETLAREIEEETGLAVGTGADQVQVQRCLGIVTYAMDHRSTGQSFPFATYHFLVQMPQDGVIAPRDATEQIGGWQWRRAQELAAVAENLEQVGSRQPAWGDWGRFRSLSHRFVASRLAGD
ncbi:MAG: NUDIX hydrolase [Caldilineaceae bacterium]|nr:NUDIX hydrolase [Caldilineaceae bacterium]